MIGDLFSIYDHLGQHDASAGLLKLAQTKNFEIKLAWYEKLQKWIRTLGIYEDLQVERPHDMEVMFGRLRCLGQLGQWEELSRVAEEARELPEHKVCRTVTPVTITYDTGALPRLSTLCT